MTEQPLPSADKRDALRARIEAAERRNAERTLADQARGAAEAAVDYTRANPLTVIGGAVALGLVIGLLTRPGRRVAGKALHSAGDAISGAASNAGSGVKRVAERGGSRLGLMLGEAVVTYAMTLIDDVIEAARTGQERASELGESAGTKARKLSADAADAAGSAADTTRSIARKTRDATLGVVRDIRRQTKD
ncbi:MAG: hypothetical protein EAY70_12850 [Sphingomonadales bacterium]|nr:MAG: hypothetical protein EAY70_12850 [Sphingomonadales bacterium]